MVGRESMNGELGENPVCQNHDSIAKAYLYTEPALPVENQPWVEMGDREVGVAGAHCSRHSPDF